MDALFKGMHILCASTAFVVALVLLDLPLKILSWIFFILIGSILCIIYPLVKDVEGPEFIAYIYDYANSKQLIATWVWQKWQY